MKKIYLFIFALSGFLFGAQQALACSCMMPGTPLEEMKKANHVYVVEVADIATKNNSLVVDVNMLESFKGTTSIKQIKTATNSAACGINFQKGDTWLVYDSSETDSHEIYSCSRTKKIDSAQEDLQALSTGNRKYTSKQVFEMVEGPTCKTATDGCNTLGLEKGTITTTTEVYCPQHTPLYECKEQTTKPDTYKTKDELIAAHPDCERASDGVNTFFGKDLLLATRKGYPQNFVAQWSCTAEKKQKNDMIMCTAQYDPVCGEDGKTYGNDCNATAANVAVVHDGECSVSSELSKNIERELEELEASIAPKYVGKIHTAVAVYKKKLLKLSTEKQVRINQKIIKKIQGAIDTLLQDQMIGTPYPKNIQFRFSILRFLELKLQVIQNDFAVKKSGNVMDCTLSDGFAQCKQK